MKLRVQGNSLRLRLNRSDVEQFRNSGVCAESLRFDSNSQLTYTVEMSSQLTAIEVQYLEDCHFDRRVSPGFSAVISSTERSARCGVHLALPTQRPNPALRINQGCLTARQHFAKLWHVLQP